MRQTRIYLYTSLASDLHNIEMQREKNRNTNKMASNKIGYL